MERRDVVILVSESIANDYEEIINTVAHELAHCYLNEDTMKDELRMEQAVDGLAHAIATLYVAQYPEKAATSQ
jgi:hypothetical protein